MIAAPTFEFCRWACWLAVATAGHRAEDQLQLVARAVSIGVAREEFRPSRGLFLLSEGHNIDVVVFRRDLLEENVAIGSAEPVENDRAQTVASMLPACGSTLWHIVQVER
jgi:hypothetical protein